MIWAMVAISAFFALYDGMRAGILSDLYISSLIVMRKGEKGLSISFMARENSGEDSGDASGYIYTEGEGKSFNLCIEDAENKLGKHIFLGHLKTIMVEEDLIKGESKLSELTDYAERTSYFNHFVRLCFLSDKDKLLEDKLENKDEATNDFLNSIVGEYPLKGLYVIKYNEIITGEELFCLPYLACSEDGLAFEGLAAIKNGIYKKKFEDKDHISYRLLVNKSEDMYMDVPGGDVRISDSRSVLRYSGEEGFSCNLVIDVILEAFKADIDVQKKGEEAIEGRLGVYYKQLIEDFIEECKTESLDLAGLEKHLYRFHYRSYEKMRSENFNILQNIPIKVNVKVNIVKNELTK